LSCNLDIGDACFALSFSDKNLETQAEYYYDGFVSKKTPDITIDVEIVYDQQEPEMPISTFDSKMACGNCFSFLGGLIQGEWFIEKRLVKARVARILLSGGGIRHFEQFLMDVYCDWMNLCHSKPGFSSFLVHGCGVERDGLGYLFTGPSESGKSTIASLLEQGNVLNDEIVLVHERDGQFDLQSTPFTGDFKQKKNLTAPLQAVFFLAHARENKIDQVDLQGAISEFARQIVVCQSSVVFSYKEMLESISNFTLSLVSDLDFYRLFFLPDKRFWRLIDNLSLRFGGVLRAEVS